MSSRNGTKISKTILTFKQKGRTAFAVRPFLRCLALDIEVLVHRQSIVHSGVELSDGAVIAQLGTPDMRLPIQYALTYPERSDYAFEKLDLFKIVIFYH